MHKVIHDTESGLFWVDLEQDFKAKVVYELKNDVMHITSTVVPEELRGKGYGKVMMEYSQKLKHWAIKSNRFVRMWRITSTVTKLGRIFLLEYE